jgi:predicted nucleic acid-binding protein
MVCLETDFLIALLRKDPKAIAILLDFNLIASTIYGQISAELEKEGKPIGET